MRKINLVFIILAALYLPVSCQQLDCKNLPSYFTSYEKATKTVTSTSFSIIEKINTPNSSWIKAASFYSCDGKSGFFLLKTNKKEYLHSGLPIGIWRQFKVAVSFGSYYVNNIKNRYQLQLK